MNKLTAAFYTAAVASAALWSFNQANAALIYEVLPDTSLLQNQSITIDGSSQTELAGGIKLEQVIGGSPVPPVITTVCLDVNGTLKPGLPGTMYMEVPFAGLTGLDPAWGNNGANAPDAAAAMRAIQNAAQIYGINAPSAITATQWAAIQLAVWEALYDTGPTPVSPPGLNLSTGRFTAAPSVATTLASGELVNASFPIIGSVLVPIDSKGNVIDDFQEFLINVTPIPEPSTVIAGLLLLLPFAASTLRFARRGTGAPASA